MSQANFERWKANFGRREAKKKESYVQLFCWGQLTKLERQMLQLRDTLSKLLACPTVAAAAL